MKWPCLQSQTCPLWLHTGKHKPLNARIEISCTQLWCTNVALVQDFKHFPRSLSQSQPCSQQPFYYHITSYDCRDLEGDLDSGKIICLHAGVSQGTASWLNTAQLKSWDWAHYFDAFIGSDFYKVIFNINLWYQLFLGFFFTCMHFMQTNDSNKCELDKKTDWWCFAQGNSCLKNNMSAESEPSAGIFHLLCKTFDSFINTLKEELMLHRLHFLHTSYLISRPTRDRKRKMDLEDRPLDGVFPLRLSAKQWWQQQVFNNFKAEERNNK